MQTTETKTTQELAQQLAYGRTTTFLLPSGYEVTIREQNGNDDDILSNVSTARDMSNFNIFISSLIVNTNLPFAVGGKLTNESAKKLLVKDKYYILIMSRIHSIGDELRISYQWDKDRPRVDYIEDLNRYVWDYSKKFPEEGDENYDKERIEPYIIPEPYGQQVIELKSGKKLRFNLFNGESELFMLRLPETEHTNNSEIKARNLEEYVGDGFVKVQTFRNYTPREMSELRKLIKIADPPFNAFSELQNPDNLDQVVNFPILGVNDFFYPEEI